MRLDNLDFEARRPSIPAVLMQNFVAIVALVAAACVVAMLVL